MRRPRLVALPAALLVAGLALGVPAEATDAHGHHDGPPTVTGADLKFTHPSRTLSEGTADEAGLLQEYVEQIVPSAAAYMEPGGPSGPNPSHPGFAVLAARNGVIVEHDARGHELRYAGWDADTGTPVELPPDEWEPMQPDTIFDMASVTKLFTSVVVTQLAERGELDLDAPVVTYIPEFGQNGKDEITIKQLLTHTSGMRAWLPLYSAYPTAEERIAGVYASTLQPNATPGGQYIYSDLGLITLGKVIEEIAGAPLDQVVAERITEPLGMDDTMYNPPESLHHRVAATEDMPWTGRGIVRGEVHDENAWSLDGVAGHAGIFSTVSDMAVFGQMILNGGRYGDVRILGQDSVRAMLTNLNPGLGGSAARGLGWQLDQRFYMDAMTSPVTTGHTGYTGTSLVVDPLSDSLLVLHTNRVHPTREWGTVSSYRRAPAREMARAVPVKPAVGSDAWFSGQQDATTVSLTAPLAAPADNGVLTFRLWYDTESTDVGRLLASSDDGSTWEPVPMDLRTSNHRWSTEGAFSGFSGRQWLAARAELPAETTHVRWSYAADSIYQGRGVYVDGVRVVDGTGLLFNGERPADAERFGSDGWVQSAD